MNHSRGHVFGLLAKHHANRKGQCMFRDQFGSRCDKPAILSHTVQRATGLKCISEQGHVLTISHERPAEDTPKVNFRRVGLRKASVFPGFCAKHDHQLFHVIEGGIKEIGLKELLIVAYRSICQEVFKKERNLRIFSDFDLIKSIEVQNWPLIESFLEGTRLSMLDLDRERKRLEELIHSDSVDGFQGLMFQFPDALPFTCASSVCPEFDFDGAKVLPGISDEWHNVSWFAGRFGGRDVLLIGGIIFERPEILQFLNSLKKIPLEEAADFALNLSVFYAENTFYRESWVRSLTEENRSWICSKFQETIPGEALSGSTEVFDFRKLIEHGANKRQSLGKD